MTSLHRRRKNDALAATSRIIDILATDELLKLRDEMDKSSPEKDNKYSSRLRKRSPKDNKQSMY